MHQALTAMGFKDREARARVAAIRTHVGVLGSFDSALRAALAWVLARTV
jgi:Holliday junction resolvasome RuvABC DNA-binding subunit